MDQQDPTAGFGGVYGDFTAKRLSDIKKTIKHHLMFVEYAIRKERDGYFVRHNLYCPQNYENNKLLPDGELQLVNGEIISVEVDTGSMRLSQLVGKFENYKNFFDHCLNKNQPIPWIAITFVTSQDDVPLEKNANLKRIFSAASIGLVHYCWEVDILVGEYRLMQLLQNNQELLLNNNIPIPSRATSMEIDKVETYKESNEAIQQPVVEKTETSWEEKRQKYVQAEEERIRKELYKEAHKKWYELPEKNRTIVIGAHFGFIGGERVENTEKKKRLINEYFDSNIDARIKKIKVPLLFFDD
ncbi:MULTISPECIES: hypothetical protein [Bacillaceae]|uniref:Replication-relaxation family protein n=1 Tax=Evansella alkalicola TaxID=745819 RepID=A0ABS6JRZ8_9BACI|nr:MULTISPECIES: hypothetical protein [Bacillaceae]MBU9721343.1 replication-relaxation family protein [Bacillus alkalicola]